MIVAPIVSSVETPPSSTDDRSAPLKAAVKAHWEEEACGTRALDTRDRQAFFDRLESERYQQEPYIRSFAGFDRSAGLRVLEIGVGAGTDFVQWARHGAVASGVDLTRTGVALTAERLRLGGHIARLAQADAETLPFADASFDLVYSWGVLHHSPDTPRAIAEVRRVLRPGGRAKVMVYHSQSIVVLLLWIVRGLLRLRPWQSPRQIVFESLESPGTKVYTREQGRALFSDFKDVSVDTRLGSGDLLLMRPSARYRNPLAALAWRLYPRWLIRLLGDRFGLFLLIEGRK